MKPTTILRLLGLLAMTGLTTALPLEATTDDPRFRSSNYWADNKKWNQGRDYAFEVVDLMSHISIGRFPFLDPGYGDYSKFSREHYAELVERYFGYSSYTVVENVLLPMFSRMQEGLMRNERGPKGPLEYRYDRGDKGFTGSAYTEDDVIRFANQALVKHPFVDKIPDRARVWIHEMTHLNWVNGGLGDVGVHDTPTSSIYYIADSLREKAAPLDSIYGETLTQYLAQCYPNKAPFNSDNVARFAMAVHHAARTGKMPRAAKIGDRCPYSRQGPHPYFDLPSVPRLSREIGGSVEIVKQDGTVINVGGKEDDGDQSTGLRLGPVGDKG
ncbi:hypothetical protein CLAFUW4_10777 [Fulvia fulva]|uniref:Uncharacterized protein n=1 Tax=Passalora fulva TaxID=5499 RepID=A0A9Q8URI8_PASFU|nr:uncharacterized protein CLAFUR5_09820 [Fulvia fulva]KAK4619923.1 hypothetical protein CLAFUR4_10782 [Fulvia fulva]KAK4621040.1 hypothetical protein CLAFUR0_10789 [Fulvia fulva]UJO19854.1 hypothetical protein CLAFUR5_09820 [Fulvia fulva]WPV16925.1 hypothetical protein CLAFUW4_10777 [Fulvia fulva]WPV32370.1 hypothetical protein CLAFUW7_10775 [Fulvia fulva]